MREIDMPSGNPMPLAERPMRGLSFEQLDAFTAESIRAEAVGTFSPELPEGKSVVAIDIGGDSLTASVKKVMAGKLYELESLVDLYGVKNGSHYMNQLEAIAAIADQQQLPVGISFCGRSWPVSRCKICAGPNSIGACNLYY
jgi:hypothetical protein